MSPHNARAARNRRSFIIERAEFPELLADDAFRNAPPLIARLPSARMFRLAADARVD